MCASSFLALLAVLSEWAVRLSRPLLSPTCQTSCCSLVNTLRLRKHNVDSPQCSEGCHDTLISARLHADADKSGGSVR